MCCINIPDNNNPNEVRMAGSLIIPTIFPMRQPLWSLSVEPAIARPLQYTSTRVTELLYCCCCSYLKSTHVIVPGPLREVKNKKSCILLSLPSEARRTLDIVDVARLEQSALAPLMCKKSCLSLDLSADVTVSDQTKDAYPHTPSWAVFICSGHR